MKVLVATKFWFRRGGLENVALDEVDWLEANGHEVAGFSTARDVNQPSAWSDYFVRYYELGSVDDTRGADRLRAAARMFYNREAAEKFGRLVDAFRPDIVHAHGIHRQLSPSILRVARAKRVPVVQTLHDYHPICPQDLLTRAGEAVCEPRRCGRYNYVPCLTNRCMKGSLAVSTLSAAELFWRRWVLRYDSLVDLFVSPSDFLAEMIRGAGYRTPVTVVPNAVAPEILATADEAIAFERGGEDDGGSSAGEPVSGDDASARAAAPGGSSRASAGSTGTRIPPGPYFLYAGRVARDKGTDTIVEAVRRAGVSLVVAGDGPLLDSLAASAPPGVVFTGRLERWQVADLLRDSVGAVVPSQWYENASISVLEAMAAGRPLVASRIAGITEQIRDGVDGFLVEPHDVDAFARGLRTLADDPQRARRMGASARERALGTYSPDRHGELLVHVYERVVAGAARGGS